MKFKVLRERMREMGYTDTRLCRELGISRSTFYRRMNGISEFTLHEIRLAMELLDIPDPRGIFF